MVSMVARRRPSTLTYTDRGAESDARPLPPARKPSPRAKHGYFFIFNGSLTASKVANSTL